MNYISKWRAVPGLGRNGYRLPFDGTPFPETAAINAIIDQRRGESMFTKASLVLIVALLVAILVNQRSQQVVQAQGAIECKVVVTGDLVTAEGKPALPGARDAHFVTAQEVLDEYGKAGWQLVTHSFFPYNGNVGGAVREQLIFMRK